MPYVIAGVAVVLIGALAALAWWLKIRAADQKQATESNRPILSFVALLREHRHMEPIMIATAARKAWGADLSCGEGEEEGADGFVVGMEISSVIRFRERMILVNYFPSPYVADPQAAAENISDLRLKSLFAEHTAWLSCDAMGEDDFSDPEVVREWYRVLGPLLAELVDENCLAIFLPLTDHLFANMPETLETLRSSDPLASLQEEAPVPVIQISGDDPRMVAAVEEARRRWPEFVAALESQTGRNFGVKAPITYGDNTEFIWLEVTAVENDVIYGTLANEPMNLGSLKLGSRVRTSLAELNDWGYIDAAGKPQGMFTVKVLVDAQREARGKQGQADSE
jgi:uncharacterized protein YegJ (DUF2314 family)